MIKKDNGV